MLKNKCNKCGKEIEIPTKSDEECNSTGVWCECLGEHKLCFKCNVEEPQMHNSNCAFRFPKKGDWFYPKEVA